jgi:hypothetical protein
MDRRNLMNLINNESEALLSKYLQSFPDILAIFVFYLSHRVRPIDPFGTSSIHFFCKNGENSDYQNSSFDKNGPFY